MRITEINTYKSFSLVVLLMLIVTATFMFSFANKASAVSESSISVDVSPSNPSPYENTTITLSSFSANLDTVNISWLVNGKSDLSGVGKKSFSISVGAAGSEVKVQAKIFFPDGEIDKMVTLRPSVMVLLWQADDSYVPPFYKGKAMPTEGSTIKVVAMPEVKVGGNIVSPGNMTYVWKKDYNNDQQASGYGKSSYIYTNDYLENSSNISVAASTTDQRYTTESNIGVSASNPEIWFYKQDAELGTLWGEALGDGHRIIGDEVVVAAPYFISPKDIRRPELVFNWSIDGRSISIPSFSKNLMPLKVQEGATGSSKLELQIENTSQIFQTAKQSININF